MIGYTYTLIQVKKQIYSCKVLLLLTIPKSYFNCLYFITNDNYICHTDIIHSFSQVKTSLVSSFSVCSLRRSILSLALTARSAVMADRDVADGWAAVADDEGAAEVLAGVAGESGVQQGRTVHRPRCAGSVSALLLICSISCCVLNLSSDPRQTRF